MGFLNSVSLAQHVHRNLVLGATEGEGPVNRPEAEIRKDKPFTIANPSWRVYLDNYDLLEKVEATNMVEVKGTEAPGVTALRQEYQVWDVPRNLKKAVSRAPKAEVQGAEVDGVEGWPTPGRVNSLDTWRLLYKFAKPLWSLSGRCKWCVVVWSTYPCSDDPSWDV